MKTSELTGNALDWAVAKCEGHDAELNYDEVVSFKLVLGDEYRLVWKPSTDWAQGGVIIERECISIEHCWSDDEESPAMWQATYTNSLTEEQGATPLVAAMRCYVASKLGDEIEIPTELMKGESK